MRTRSLSFCVSLILGAVLVAGCGNKGTDTSTVPATSKPRIALVMKSLANEFFKTMEDGAKADQKENAAHYDLITNGIKDETDVAKQIDLVEQMVAQKVGAIVIAPADSKAMVGVCKKAMDAGVVVVNIDNKFDSAALAEKGVKIPFVGPDNRKGASLSGAELAKKLKPGDKVAIVEGAPNAYNAEQRKLGFQDAIKAAKLNLITSQTGNWEMDKANQIVAAMITEHPDIKGIMCANDNMALGAVAALKAAGKQKSVIVVGFDNISAVQQLVKEGAILATVDQHADKLAIFGIKYALEMLGKKTTPADRETPVDLITKATLK